MKTALSRLFLNSDNAWPSIIQTQGIEFGLEVLGGAPEKGEKGGAQEGR